MTRPLHIGLNLLYLRPGVVGGTETYARGLVNGFEENAPDAQFVVFLNRSAADWPLPSRFTRVVCPVSARQGWRYLYEQTRLPFRANAFALDILHSLAYVGPVYAPWPSVVTVPDLNYRSPAHSMPLIRRMALSTVVSAVVRRSDAVIAISRFVADEIRAAMPHASTKLHVVHLAPQERSGGDARVVSDVRPTGPYFLAFSSVSANKNLPRLLEAHREARSGGMAHSLLLVGHRPAWAKLDSPGAYWTGYLPDEDVHRLLRGADALFFPSLYEGFGIPVLEAMQTGVAVACSARASLPEVAGDAAHYFDPEAVDSIADAMRRLAADSALRAMLVSRGRVRAAQFTWARAAAETLDVYQWVLDRRSSPTP
jgi:glycosyltransferase involved in cell wall biosynthesis